MNGSSTAILLVEDDDNDVLLIRRAFTQAASIIPFRSSAMVTQQSPTSAAPGATRTGRRIPCRG
jgi:hypothetical protein